jgi:hypothetical protein
MLSLRELQAQFVTALLADATAEDERIAIYRNTVFANYRNALRATYPVVQQLVGTPFFDAAVDAYVLAVPSTGGDLNVYGERFGDFLAEYPHARELAYLPDVARLEWAVDRAHRAADDDGSAEAVLAALAAVPGSQITAQHFALDASCGLLASDHPVMRIWQVHQPGFAGDTSVRFGNGADLLLVRRETSTLANAVAGAVGVVRLAPGDFALLRSLGNAGDLAQALDAALTADPTFDLGTALREYIGNRTIIGLM